MNKEDNIQNILNSNNLFNLILNSKKIKINFNDKSIKYGLFCNPNLFEIANYLLLHEKKYPNELEMLLEFGYIHNKKVFNLINEQFKRIKDLTLDTFGNIKTKDNIKISSLFYYKLNQEPDLNLNTLKKLENINKMIDDFHFTSITFNNGFSKNQVELIDNTYIIKKSTDNKDEYDFLKIMNNENISFISKLIKQENGFDYFSYFKGKTEKFVKEMNINKIKSIVGNLKIMNDISKKYLKDNEVYVHSDLSPLNTIFLNNKVIGIIDFDSIKIAEEYEDLIYIIWTWLNIGSHNRNDLKILDGIKEILNIYDANINIRNNFSDKIIEIMNERLKNTKENNSNYLRIKNWVNESKEFVFKYKDEIDKVSKK